MRAQTHSRAGAVLRAAAAGALAAGTSAGFGAVLSGRAAAGALPAGWTRENYRGREVSLGGGAGAALGAAMGAALLPTGCRAAGLLMVGAGAVAGAYDDLAAPGLELRGDKGLRGHLRALRSGRPSGGVVKVAVIGAAALGAARLTGATGAAALTRAVTIAAGANAVNLLDLRPGRAGKAVVAVSAPLLLGQGGAIAAVAAGAAAGALPGDLRETRMLGDTGANALGALLGLRLSVLPGWARPVAAVAVAGLSLISERVSFSAVIADTPWLTALDRLGRAPQ
jgi:hypothetical protein